MKKKLLLIIMVVFFALLLSQSVGVGLAHSMDTTTVSFCYKDKTFTYRETGKNTQRIHTLVDEHQSRVRPTHAERMSLCRQMRGLGFSYRASVEHAFAGICRTADRAKSFVDLAPQPAQISFYPDSVQMFRLQREQCGYEVNLEEVYKSVYYALDKSNSAKITLRPTVLNHEINFEALSACTNLRSRFCTDFSSSSPQRKHNIALAFKRLNGSRLNAGEMLSFNAVVGARSVRNGFMEAKIIRNGQFEDGVGGGVCQSSTTLYNAAVLAGLNIVKVSQHSLPVGYVEPSFDAMVNSSGADLVVSNDGSLPVFLKTYCTNEKVIAEFYGAPLPYNIVRRSETISTIPHGGDKEIIDTAGKYIDKVMYKGDKVRIAYPKDGLTSLGYLDYYKNGTLIKSERIRKNKYAAQYGLIVHGTHPKPPPEPPAPQPPLQQPPEGQ